MEEDAEGHLAPYAPPDHRLGNQADLFGAANAGDLLSIYYSLLESAPDAMVVVDTEGRIVFSNQQTVRLFGHEREDLIGKEVEVLVPQRFRSEHPAHRERYMKNPHFRGMGVGLELSGRRKDGSEFPVEISLSPIRFKDRMFVAAAIRDATERKAAERARHLATERGQEIERLEKEKRFKAQFLNMVSHELNTPITPLKLQLHLLEHKILNDDRKGAMQSVEVLDRNLRRLARLVKDVLDVSRLEAGRLRIDVEKVDLAKTLEHTQQSFEIMTGDSDDPPPVKIDLDIPQGQDLEVAGDPDRIQQVFDNLVANAVRLSPPGGSVIIHAASTKKEVIIEVDDRGPGLSEEQISRLFKPFSQVHDKKRDHRGTGLGLYVSRGIVNAHGGSISAESEGPGKGAVFRVVLPRAGPPASSRVDAARPHGDTSRPRPPSKHSPPA
jgi:two-component system, LuxR family, sensor kinase FixL